jgi:hypothetical protein
MMNLTGEVDFADVADEYSCHINFTASWNFYLHFIVE